MSPSDKKNSFEELRCDKKKIERRYERLVEKFEAKCISLIYLENSTGKMQVRTACIYLNENWDE